MTSPAIIQEDHRNATENYMLGEPDRIRLEDSILDGKPLGEMYRWLVREHGRCTCKVWVDTENGDRLHVGWVFLKRDRYEDTGETFLHETWVTLLERSELVRHVDYFASASHERDPRLPHREGGRRRQGMAAPRAAREMRQPSAPLNQRRYPTFCAVQGLQP